VQGTLVAKCYDNRAGAFFDLAGNAEQPLRTLTITSLVPLALPTLDRAIVDRLLAHLADRQTFALPYPVPSVAANEPTFMPGNAHGFIWRGPRLDQHQLVDRRRAARPRRPTTCAKRW